MNELLKKLVTFPKLIILLLLLVFGVFLNWVDDFQLDASSDTLLLEGDEDLRYYKNIKARYGDDEFLVVTFQPYADLFDPITINSLADLRNELERLDSIDSVVSILDVPLIKSPPMSLSELEEKTPSYLSPETDKKLAQDELLNSTLYKNLIISNDGRTTALLLNLVINESLNLLVNQRDELREKRLTQTLKNNEKLELERLSDEIKSLRASYRTENALMIKNIRDVLNRYQDNGKIFLGGVPMITVDMIDFIQNDIEVFGTSLLLFLFISLLLIFKNPRWMFISMACCVLGLVVMTGFLGIVGWPVTVVSANFVALLLIFSLSISVHLTVRYIELNELHPNQTQVWLVQQTLIDKWEPCLYTTITTMVGFASLLVAGLKPVIDFGWMMLISMGAIFIMVFLLFPSILVQLKKLNSKKKKDLTLSITNSLSNLVLTKPKSTFSTFLIMAILSGIGISSLTAENQFIKAFKENTEIYQGLSVIDRELGGTTPLDIIIEADPSYFEEKLNSIEEDDFFDDEFFEEDFSEEETMEYDIGADSYWYNSFRLKTIDSVHEYLESLDEAGKVVSISTTMDVLKSLNDDQEIDTFFLSLLYKKVPQDVKEALFDPYISEDGNQLRISFRVFESYPNLKRNELIKKIKKDLVEVIGLKESQVKLTGMLVLYNNVLESLIRSQILTIGVVFLAILTMFLFLFRSLKFAFVAIIPSILASASVLGLMGWLSIPLDIMTITIAAICIGIGVDHSIHYIHRFREEIKLGCSAKMAVKNSHASIGKAIYYTSIIIIIGFSILSLSNFVPTIYFGTFTAFAMLIALIANLTLLPLLLININSDHNNE
ncbi:MAG: MMPL family transporter [Gammaproteobacteria bacterium]|nr:MMPL family transporter [Gammaproteobacteria bacterium]MDG2434115.1 MMPL family transporter [Gammaproteobacteria bacterium]